MPLSPRLIRRRIRSVGNTKKITKAMELVAAAKMRRAVAAALKTRAYANLAWGMVASLREAAHEDVHPLLRSSNDQAPNSPPKADAPLAHKFQKDRGALYVVMASDRGLCGGFNAALFREVVRDVFDRRGGAASPPADRHRGTNIAGGDAAPPLHQMTTFIAIGKKAEQFVRRQGWELAASFTNLSVAPTVAELRPVARMVIEQFIGGQVDEVRIAFTDFISSLRQQPRVRTLLPLQRMEEVGPSDRRGGAALRPSVAFREGGSPPADGHRGTNVTGGHGGPPLRQTQEFLFEPDPRRVLDAMLPRLVELQVYQCYLETGASEHSARMLAMRNASDAAKDMIDSLTLTFNQARQAMITREIAEIAAGRAALA